MTLPKNYDDPIWRMKETCRQVGRSSSSIYRLINEGNFPQPIKIGKRSIGFLASQVTEWKERRIAESRKSEEVRKNG